MFLVCEQGVCVFCTRVTDAGLVGRGTARAEDAQETPTLSHISLSILASEIEFLPASPRPSSRCPPAPPIAQGSGFRVQGAGFRVQGSGFRVQGAGCRGARARASPRPSSRCPPAPAIRPVSFLKIPR